MTTRTLTHPTAGPVLFDARSFAADIEVVITSATHATVTVSTTDTDGPSHQAVTDARVGHRPGELSAAVSDQEGASGVTIVRAGRGVSVVATTITAGMSIVGGRVFVNGAEITNTPTGSAPVTVRAELPRGSKVRTSTEAGRIRTDGSVASVEARTVSGDVLIDQAETATIVTTSGDIEIRDARQASARTVSGDIDIDRVGGVNAESVSGDVTVREATGHADARTVSGDIEIRHSGQTPRTSTVTGRVRVTAAR
jgi:Putative adhesin